MCGLIGLINNNNRLDTNKIALELNHRGPDEQGNYLYENVEFFHNRLSIIDIGNGSQPFSFGKYTIIFNGEIYNYKALKEYLFEFSFSTTSDTEVLLFMYIKYKENMFSKIDGMFSFAILDENEDKIILARDRAGEKPLYLYQNNDLLLFSSEIKSIKNNVKKLNINEEAIESYLRCGFFFNTVTAYEDLVAVKAGHYYTIDINSLKIEEEQYFDIKDYYNQQEKLNFKDSLNRLDSLLHNSVKDRLESSDLEVGAFLSGGIDSSLIVAMASEYKNTLKTFTVKFDGAFDESHLAKLTANKYGTKHYELPISMNLKNDIETILLNYGQPFMDSSAIPSYYVSKEAKKHVTVILNGDGADELFGGYRRYVPVANSLISKVRYFSFLKNILPNSHDKKSLYNYFYRLLSMADKNGLDFYLSSTTDIFEDIYKFPENSINKSIEKLIQDIDFNSLSKMQYLDFRILLFSDLLVKMDIATMSHSLEARSPFLSKDILEFAPSVRSEYKIKGTTTKYILRELAKKYLPKELIQQPKRGFEVPLKKWVEGDLKENIFDTLSQNSYSTNFINQSFISNLLNDKVNISREKRAKMLWTMYCLEVWKKDQ